MLTAQNGPVIINWYFSKQGQETNKQAYINNNKRANCKTWDGRAVGDKQWQWQCALQQAIIKLILPAIGVYWARAGLPSGVVLSASGNTFGSTGLGRPTLAGEDLTGVDCLGSTPDH